MGLARIHSTTGAPHLDLWDGPRRAGSVWPTFPKPDGHYNHVAVCTHPHADGAPWREEWATEQGAITALEQHHQRAHSTTKEHTR